MNRSEGPEEAHNETLGRDQLTLNTMHMALVAMLLKFGDLGGHVIGWGILLS
jgi:hypothetical protein